MKRVLLALAVMGLVAGGASAQDDLTGGVFMCHHPPGLVYTSDSPAEGWCPSNDLAGCAENNDEITMDPIVWFVCAAFENPSVWCGVEFGISYTPYSWIPLEYDVCSPGGFLTIPTAGWPGPNEGISIATTDVSWSGNFEEVYWFGGYGYYGGVWCLYDNPGSPGTVGFSNCSQVEFPAECFGCIGFGAGNMGNDCCPEPQVPEGACCYNDGTCAVLPEADCTGVYQGDDVPCNPCPQPGACCVADVCHFVIETECDGLGGMFLGEGVGCVPNPCVTMGACCYADGSCAVLPEADCTGVYQGDDVPCNPCPQPGACCVDDVCHFVIENDCTALGGAFLGEGVPCVPNPCVEYGACCYPDGTCSVVESGTCTGLYLGDGTDCGPPNPCPQPAACCIDHTCYFVLVDECTAMMGVYMGDGTTCEPVNPCDVFTPADPTSWGTIKAIYR